MAADGVLALSFLKETEPVAWLAPHPDLSIHTKAASQFLFALSSSAAAASQCPIKHLLVHNFDPEQIWQQIDMQATPLLASARRILRRIERDTDSVVLIETAKPTTSEIGMHEEELETIGRDRKEDGAGRSRIESVDEEEEEEDDDDDDDDDDESLEEEDEESHEEEDDDESDSGGDNAVEDEFFKLKDMKKFLDEAEAVDDGPGNDDDDDEEEDEEEGEYIDMDDGEELLGDNTEDELEEGLKYNAFFKDKSKVKKSDAVDETLTTHEKQVAKVRKRIEQLEKANIESDVWTMRGEVSAPKRPKNSALEVELDFEHNVRPPPVITEEVTASLEDLIRKRIAEHNFDDVQRKPSLATSTPKEVVELDETKSKKGLAEIYEANYMQTTGLAPAPTSQADEIRKEATQLFKALCVKLDALSHFHFTPKPVIEDMTVRPDVPALAMEEIAPLLVSDAQLLAPEEVFTGEGVLKAEAELSRDERRRRRARKKEKAKSIKRRTELNKKPGPTVDKAGEVNGSLQGSKKTQRSDFVKSTKVFDQLDGTRNGKKQLVEAQDLHAPFLKL